MREIRDIAPNSVSFDSSLETFCLVAPCAPESSLPTSSFETFSARNEICASSCRGGVGGGGGVACVEDGSLRGA